MPSQIDRDAEPSTVPFADESRPGLGRNGAVQAEERRQSTESPFRPFGAPGVEDQPSDNPVRNDTPFKNLRG